MSNLEQKMELKYKDDFERISLEAQSIIENIKEIKALIDNKKTSMIKLNINRLVSDIELSEESLKEIRQYFNFYKDYGEKERLALEEKFAKITTWNELQALKTEMDSWGCGLHFEMTTKVGGKENGMFKIDDSTVEYLTDRTSRVYKCQIKNLHKIMCIKS